MNTIKPSYLNRIKTFSIFAVLISLMLLLSSSRFATGAEPPQPTLPQNVPEGWEAPTSAKSSVLTARSAETAQVASLTVDTTTVQHDISDGIYGINLGDEAAMQNWQTPINRWGGNALTRYNWEIDVYNPGNYFFYENIVNPDPGTLPNNSESDKFVERNQRVGADSLLQVPTLGYVAKDRTLDCGFRWSRYGWQTEADWRPEWDYADSCGNGIAGGTEENITGNDPADTSIPTDPAFVQAWMEHLIGRYGTADNGGVKYYQLDNEPMIWFFNHRDVNPQFTSYDDVRDIAFDYGSAIKETDPTAKVMGPGVWGWVPYFHSSVDTQNPDANPDRDQYGMDFLPWYLSEMQRYEDENGVRILDYLDIHYYPQAYGPSGAISLLNEGGDAETQALRLRSTKDLWDPTYTAESWIGTQTNVIPRMRDWIDEYYPGTELAITEYRWGGLADVNGALAQADVLGIFGREDVAIASLWDAPAVGEPGDFAFRMYRNFDGQGTTFGDQSLTATSTDQDELAIYAARNSTDGGLTIMVINKTLTAQTAPVTLNGEGTGEAAVYRYSRENETAIERQPNQTITNGAFTHTFPAESITLFAVGTTVNPNFCPNPGLLHEWWSGVPGSQLSDLTSWGAYPDSPTDSGTLTSFETPKDIAEGYGTRVRGYLEPSVSGAYTFWVASDDQSSLLLSTDEDPTNAVEIAKVSSWTSPRAWDWYSEQESATINLVAGERYYIEALMKEGFGGDHLAVAWQVPGSSRAVISSGNLCSFELTGNAPTANISATPTSGTAPVAVSFDGTGSTDSDGTIASYTWDFGDSTGGSGATTSHTYNVAGTYNATLTVIDNDGRSNTTSVAITVSPGSGGACTDNGLLWEYWLDVPGSQVSDLTSSANYPTNPSGSGLMPDFDVPYLNVDDYGVRVRGYIIPPVSGDYTFWVASDDSSQLWLSTDDSPANISQIASVNDWTSYQQFGKFASQQSAEITLVGGVKYYVESFMKEGFGGDHLTVAWQPPGGTQAIIPNAYLCAFVGTGGGVQSLSPNPSVNSTTFGGSLIGASMPVSLYDDMTLALFNNSDVRLQLEELSTQIDLMLAYDSEVSAEFITAATQAYNDLRDTASPELREWLDSKWALIDLAQYEGRGSVDTWNQINGNSIAMPFSIFLPVID